jgi:hypothetical protein
VRSAIVLKPSDHAIKGHMKRSTEPTITFYRVRWLDTAFAILLFPIAAV